MRNVSIECNATQMLDLSSAKMALYSRKSKWGGIWRSLPSDPSTFQVSYCVLYHIVAFREERNVA